jgi:hypothetical protein
MLVVGAVCVQNTTPQNVKLAPSTLVQIIVPEALRYLPTQVHDWMEIAKLCTRVPVNNQENNATKESRGLALS